MRKSKKKCLYIISIATVLIVFKIICEVFLKNTTKLNEICMLNETFEFDTRKNPNSIAKIQITYAHFLDTNDEPTIENFKFFMNFAYEPCHQDVDYIIILNLEKSFNLKSIFENQLLHNAFDDIDLFQKFVSCQDEKNLNRNTYLMLRKNKDGGDLCAFVDLIKTEFWTNIRSSYSYFFFINSSARGPFLPNYWNRKW